MRKQQDMTADGQPNLKTALLAMLCAAVIVCAIAAIQLHADAIDALEGMDALVAIVGFVSVLWIIGTGIQWKIK